MKSEEFLQAIRGTEGLSRAVLSKITVEGREVVFSLVTDSTYTQDDIMFAEREAARFVPAGFSASVKVTKSVPSEEGVRRAILSFVAERYPAVAAFLRPEDVRVDCGKGGGQFRIAVPARVRPQSDEVLDAVHAMLKRKFCGSWSGEFVFSDRAIGEIEAEVPPAELLPAPRFFPVTGYEAIDGGAPEHAIYMADLSKEEQGISVCGRLTYIEERLTKTGKPYFTLTLSDGSASLRCSYFSKKATVEKVRSLRAGDGVCLTGDNELWNGALSFRAKFLDRGTPPEGFVPESRPSRPVPARYRAVFPSPDSDFVQGDLFGASGLPADFVRGKFVVFDIETTGLNSTPSASMDRIIELGAVKIENGKICERFSTFVSCPVKLPDEIVNLTGITDEMLVGAPPIGDVIADFYKFSDGCALVGHNAVGFDCKFIRYYGEREGYLFEQRQIDTMSLAQEQLRLSNYKLNTIAEHFGFTFRHHRAYDDAFVTAKIFIELVRMRGGLPR